METIPSEDKYMRNLSNYSNNTIMKPHWIFLMNFEVKEAWGTYHSQMGVSMKFITLKISMCKWSQLVSNSHI